MKTKRRPRKNSSLRRPSEKSKDGLSAGGGATAMVDHTGVSRSLQFMSKNYTRPIQLDDMVKVSGMSRRGFVKAFNRLVGRNPGSFMRQARIEFAKQLLLEQDLPLKDIATATGFRSDNTLCIAFQRETGMSPKRFQRQAWLSAYHIADARQIFDTRPHGSFSMAH